MKNGVFWDVSPCGSCRRQCFGGTYRSVLQSPATLTCFSSLIVFTLKMEEIRSSEMSVHTRTTRRHIPKNAILHSHRRESPDLS
jgi:hypothetical protein